MVDRIVFGLPARRTAKGPRCRWDARTAYDARQDSGRDEPSTATCAAGQPGGRVHRDTAHVPDMGTPRTRSSSSTRIRQAIGPRSLEGGADARYLPTGHLLYVRRGALMAAPFNLARLRVTGGSVGVMANVMQAANMWGPVTESGAGQFAVAGDGKLVYVAGRGMRPDAERSLVWVDRTTGRVKPLDVPMPRRFIDSARLSGDGRVAFFTLGYNRAIWIPMTSNAAGSRGSPPSATAAGPCGRRTGRASSSCPPAAIFR